MIGCGYTDNKIKNLSDALAKSQVQVKRQTCRAVQSMPSWNWTLSKMSSSLPKRGQP